MELDSNGVIKEELWSDERIGRELNPDAPLTPDAVRKEMSRAGIPKLSGRSARLVRAYRKHRKGRGHRTDLREI